MCQDFSCIVTKSHQVIWERGISSHDALYSKYLEQYPELRESSRSSVKVEITPTKGYLYPKSAWDLRVDEEDTPDWWSASQELEATRALKKWRADVYALINIEEARRPINPLNKKRKPTKKDIELLTQWASVGASVGASVRDSVRASVRDSVRDSVWDSGFGQHDAPWLGFYDFFRRECGLERQMKALLGLTMIAKTAGWFIPHQKICWISERHNIVRRIGTVLHCEDGPAVAYPDGWEIFALHGVRMQKDHVMTPAEQMDPKAIVAETNVEVRRELIRKIGVERFIQVSGATVKSKSGNYELLSVRLSPEVTDAKYLKMLNPSAGCWHVEGVHPSCTTVQEAINWRASGDKDKIWKPTELT